MGKFKFQRAVKERAGKRRAKAKRLHESGKTWAEVGKALGGISPQRAFQLASKADQ